MITLSEGKRSSAQEGEKRTLSASSVLSPSGSASQPRAGHFEEDVGHEDGRSEEAKRRRHRVLLVAFGLLAADDVQGEDHVHDEGTAKRMFMTTEANTIFGGLEGSQGSCVAKFRKLFMLPHQNAQSF